MPRFKSSGQNKSRFAGRGRRKMSPAKRKFCRFCVDKADIDYKNLALIRTFVTERGKILPGRITGTCAKHQRELGVAIKRARMLAFIPYSVI